MQIPRPSTKEGSNGEDVLRLRRAKIVEFGALRIDVLSVDIQLNAIDLFGALGGDVRRKDASVSRLADGKRTRRPGRQISERHRHPLMIPRGDRAKIERREASVRPGDAVFHGRQLRHESRISTQVFTGGTESPFVHLREVEPVRHVGANDRSIDALQVQPHRYRSSCPVLWHGQDLKDRQLARSQRLAVGENQIGDRRVIPLQRKVRFATSLGDERTQDALDGKGVQYRRLQKSVFVVFVPFKIVDEVRIQLKCGKSRIAERPSAVLSAIEPERIGIAMPESSRTPKDLARVCELWFGQDLTQTCIDHFAQIGDVKDLLAINRPDEAMIFAEVDAIGRTQVVADDRAHLLGIGLGVFSAMPLGLIRPPAQAGKVGHV